MTASPQLSIIIPAFNEERRLPPTLRAIRSYFDESEFRQAEVIVVDDGSTDGTAALVEKTAQNYPCLRLVKNPGNRGKGYAVRHGMLEAHGEWRLLTDADLSAPIEELQWLLNAMRERNVQIAIGSRALDRSLIGVHQSRWREVSGIFFNRVMRFVTGLPFADTQCGFKLFHADAAQAVFSRQRIDGFGFDVEDLFIAQQLGIYTVEIPVQWNNVEGTKVSLVHGLRSFLDLGVVRWNGIMGRYK